MKKVSIRCILNNKLIAKCYIIIFDKYNNKVYDAYSNCGKKELYLNRGVYKIIIIPFDINLCTMVTSFIVMNDINCFNFGLLNDSSPKITVILVDKNYDRLPIERGEIKLWPDHIQ